MRLENFFTYYKKELIASQTAVEQAILQGVPKWDEYKYLTGKLHALKQEVQELTDLLKKTELEDEEINCAKTCMGWKSC